MIISGCVLIMGVRKWRMEDQAEKEQRARRMRTETERVTSSSETLSPSEDTEHRQFARSSMSTLDLRKYSHEIEVSDLSLHEGAPVRWHD